MCGGPSTVAEEEQGGGCHGWSLLHAVGLLLLVVSSFVHFAATDRQTGLMLRV